MFEWIEWIKIIKSFIIEKILETKIKKNKDAYKIILSVKKTKKIKMFIITINKTSKANFFMPLFFIGLFNCKIIFDIWSKFSKH